MSEDKCFLTTRDFSILEAVLEGCLGRDDALAPLLRRKLNAATVVFGKDVPDDAATLGSRVIFSVDGREPDTRVIAHEQTSSSVGLSLPITNPRGLALLGLREGQAFRLTNRDGIDERILLQKLLYQPEAAKRRKEAPVQPPAAAPRPALRVVSGSLAPQPKVSAPPRGGYDDPGPSAA